MKLLISIYFFIIAIIQMGLFFGISKDPFEVPPIANSDGA